MKNGEKRQRVVLGTALLRFLGAEVYNEVKIGKKMVPFIIISLTILWKFFYLCAHQHIQL